MHIISRKALREFGEKHSTAIIPLDNWYHIAKKATWTNLVEVQADFGSTDLIKDNDIIFNIGGNNFRVVVKIEFEKQLIFIKLVLTHAEYTKIYR